MMPSIVSLTTKQVFLKFNVPIMGTIIIFKLVVKFNFEKQWAFVRFIGTHSEYDKINANEV